jgi:hypothetical protein
MIACSYRPFFDSAGDNESPKETMVDTKHFLKNASPTASNCNAGSDDGPHEVNEFERNIPKYPHHELQWYTCDDVTNYFTSECRARCNRYN